MHIEIEEGLILNSPTMEINNISYPQKENKVIVECYFKELNSEFIHSRSYEFENVGGLDLVYSDVIELMKGNELLNQFV